MVDPSDVTNIKRNDNELEEFLLFCISVAGKTASQISRSLDLFLNSAFEEYYLSEKEYPRRFPFLLIRHLYNKNKLKKFIISSSLGQHNKLTRAFSQVAFSNIDLKRCTVEKLKEFHGIGDKTARYFILHSRPEEELAVLDTHILKYLKNELGMDVPRSTPTGKKYKEIEKVFVEHAKDVGKRVSDLDLEIWNKYSRG